MRSKLTISFKMLERGPFKNSEVQVEPKVENEGGGMAGISVLNISRMEELQVGPCITSINIPSVKRSSNQL